jgi:hypothetical protein
MFPSCCDVVPASMFVVVIGLCFFAFVVFGEESPPAATAVCENLYVVVTTGPQVIRACVVTRRSDTKSPWYVVGRKKGRKPTSAGVHVKDLA